MSKSYVDPVKEDTRILQYLFCDKHLRFLKNNKKKVVCFPGAESDQEVALEFPAIWDPFEVKRANITGIEKFKKPYQRLENANLGIELYFGEFYEFLQEEREKGITHKIFSIDTTSFFYEKCSYELELIASGLLGDYGVVITNYQAARESNEAQDVIKETYQFIQSGFTIEDIITDMEGTLAQVFEISFDLKHQREDSVRHSIIKNFIQGKLNLDCSIFRKVVDIDSFRKLMNEAYHEEPEFNEHINTATGISLWEKIQRHWFVRNVVVAEYWDIIKKRCTVINYDGTESKGLPEWMATLMYTLDVQPYFPEANESYKYVSNSRTPMIMDMMFLKKPKKLKKFKHFFTVEKNTRGVSIHILRGYHPDTRYKLYHEARLFVKELDELYNTAFEPTERIFLGSSYIPKEKKEQLTREQAYDLLQVGFTTEEIATYFEPYSVAQLRGFKAWLQRRGAS